MNSKSRPVIPVKLIAYWFMVASACQVLAVDPIVSRVQAKQREGSRMVDITYDVADPDSPTLTVYLKVSVDGGATWMGPVELVSGDVGLHIVPGAGKRMVWDAGKEMPNRFGVKYRYRIGASNQWILPKGMALIAEGPFLGFKPHFDLQRRVDGQKDFGQFRLVFQVCHSSVADCESNS
jgi:hypothetical protein